MALHLKFSVAANAEGTPYELDVKWIYSCLLDYVPSLSCRNIAFIKFLLLDAEERKEDL